MSFTEKVVIVTGASSGIGIEIAKLFAKEGAKLTISGRDTARLRKTAEECENISGQRPLEIIADLAKEDEVKRIIPATVERYGKIDVLVNNAALFIFKSILDDNFLSDFHKHMTVNVMAPMTLMKDASPYLIETKGNIVNISSIASFSPCSTGAAYCGSKAALDQANKCIALDLASKGVRVNVINPGPVITQYMENKISVVPNLESNISPSMFMENMQMKMASIIPLKKPAVSEEVAELVAFLASNKAKSITGVCYPLDCGCSLKGLESLMSLGNIAEM